MSRPSWDEYFIEVARLVASRATCDRLHVGAVLVRDKRIIATGYNGSPSGQPHCDDVGHLMIANHCKRTVHGEVNALLQCAKYGIPTEGAALYITHPPCPDCSRALVQAGISKVVYDQPYGIDTTGYEILMKAGVNISQLNPAAINK